MYLILFSAGNSLGKVGPPLIYFFIISKLTRQKNVATCFLSFVSTIESVKPSSLTFWTCSAEYFLLIKTRSSYRSSQMWKSNQLVFSAQLDCAERLKAMCVYQLTTFPVIQHALVPGCTTIRNTFLWWESCKTHFKN